MDTEQTNQPRKLYKSRRNRMIDGVCGGIAEYFNLDPTIVRIFWVVLTLASFGAGIILYLASMIVMPVNPEHFSTSTVSVSPGSSGARRFWGILLITLGAFLLLSNLGLLVIFSLWHLSWGIIFPLLLILLGIGVVVYSQREYQEPSQAAPETSPTSTQEPVRELRRSITDRKIFGVCGGLANYLNVDSTIIRIFFILLILASFGIGVVLYFLMAILVPEERISPNVQST